MITLKPGVGLRGLRVEALFAMLVAAELWRDAGKDLTITSVLDGNHKPGSYHYRGMAFDLRSRDLEPIERSYLYDKLRSTLGPGYDVLLEGNGTPNEHIHVEFDPDGWPEFVQVADDAS